MELTAVLVFLLAVLNAMAGEAPTIRLNDGYNIPLLALGTYEVTGDTMRQVTYWAIEAGYRHFDTAAVYGNEKQVGEGIAEAIDKGLVKREDIYLTTKLSIYYHERDQVVPALKESLRRLNMDYVDLFLIHSPLAYKADGSIADIDYLETWKGMEECKRLGLARSIGLSNFDTEQIDRIIANSDIPPAINQIEVHPSYTQEQAVFDCQIRNVTVMAYSPFGFLVSRPGRTNSAPPYADDPTLVAIANKYGKKTTQVVLRYLIDRYLIPIPKTTNKKRLEENIDVFDFRLTDDEIRTISSFNSNTRV